jgi:tyrosine decarboxylase/aspartate 1-decarboxylase
MPLPDEGLDEEALGERLHEARSKDTPFRSGRVLGSMCTAPHPAAEETYRMFMDSNLGDPMINPGVVELKDEVLELLVELVGGGAEAGGLFLSGGTEANVTAMRLARDTTGRSKVVTSEAVHFSVHKAAHALGLEVVETPLTDGYRADPEAIREAADEDTAAVVGVAGNTEFGAVDPIPRLAEIGDQVGAWTHVDAAYGGFMLPWLDDLGPFGLDVEGVDSVTVDPHKMGRAAIPAGCLLVDDEETLDAGAVETPYVSTERQAGLLSTRPGAAAASAWAALHAIGERGYRIQARGAVELAEWFAGVLEKKGATLVREPELGIVPIRVDNNREVRQRLAEDGWKVSLTTLEPGIRIVCMPHVTGEKLNEFVRSIPQMMEVDDGRIVHA